MNRPGVALITGISGQDGAYLADLLLRRGYSVHGTSRGGNSSRFVNLRRLQILNRIAIHSTPLIELAEVLAVVRAVAPTEIYLLAAQSSVGRSFEQPVETIDSVVKGTLNVLEAVRLLKLDTRIFYACSGDCFGNTQSPATEDSPFRPCSPYGVAKAAAHWLVANYRDAYALFACSGILFNHESVLRPVHFVTRKIVNAAIDIAQHRVDRVELGTLAVARDWGWAPEYVEAMALMLRQDNPDDYIISTGLLSTLESFVAAAFSYLGLDWKMHVTTTARNFRPLDIDANVGNPAKARIRLGWSARITMPQLVKKLIDHELVGRSGNNGSGENPDRIRALQP
jgi:GDPmannose 4,6-dehydratase